MTRPRKARGSIVAHRTVPQGAAILRSMPGMGSDELRDRDDAALVSLMAQRDEDGLRGLYRRYGGIAFGLANRVLGSRQLAEEVVQEVFVNAWEKASMFDEGRGTVRSWLLTQVHHRAVDVVRREDAQRKRNLRLVPDGTSEEPHEQIVEEAWIAQQRTRVTHALGTLPDEQRKVIELAYFDGRTQSQIAESTGIALGTVKSRTMVGLKRLKIELSGKEEI